MTKEQAKICTRRRRELWAIFVFVFIAGAGTGFGIAAVAADRPHHQEHQA